MFPDIDPRAVSEPTDEFPLDRPALTSMDPNIQNDSGDGPTPSKRARKEQSRKRESYRTLLESGEDPPPLDENNTMSTPHGTRTRYNSKVKQGNTPMKNSRGLPKTPASALQRLGADLPTPSSSTNRRASRPMPSTDSSTVSHDKTRSGSSLRKTLVPKPQQQTPLRSKPVSELKLSDFRPNPMYNQGYSYAFRETVRKRSDRACLPGCTRAECCGSAFRALAEAAQPLAATEQDDLLEEHLGDAYDKSSINRMTPDERRELVLQARTRQMANKHGKHRQAYERAKSPPGFWRMDFPTTQEEMEDREKALQQERDMIEERLIEASREGGKYIFRDE